MPKEKTEEIVIKTKGAVLVEFVKKRYQYSKDNMAEKHEKWKEFYDDYRGTLLDTKEPWQSNYVIPSLKEAIRIKIPLYMNILFSAGLESFDVKPGEESDEPTIPLIKDLTIYQLGNVGKNRGGLYEQWEAYMKQREIYSYTVAKIPWRIEKDKKGTLIFEGPDMEVIDIFSFYPDPGANSINDSWIILEKKDVFVSYLRMLEKEDIYTNIKALQGVSNPNDNEKIGDQSLTDDRVDLLEYHGEVPMSLIEGKLDDESTVNPYEDDYVDAIITIANEQIAIRAEEYPYDCGSIFIDSCKDRMPNEQFGIGTGEDIQAMAAELTNAHNKFNDCVNIIANPMVIVNPQKIAGLPDTVIVRPGGVFNTNPGVDNVAHAITWIDTTAAAASLTPLITHIKMMKEEIQRTSQAVPSISPTPTKKELHPTLGGTMIQQANAAEPIKHDVKHSYEPAFQKMLEIFYKHNLQFLSKVSAYRVLGKEKADIWFKEKKSKEIKKEDIKLQGNPDFIPRGVSVFAEKQVEKQELLQFLQIAPAILKPALDPMGNVQMGPDGKPVMVPVLNMEEIAKRIGEAMNFKDLEELIPALTEKAERKKAPLAGTPTPATPPKVGETSPAPRPGGALMGRGIPKL